MVTGPDAGRAADPPPEGEREDNPVARLVDDARCGDEAAWDELVSRFTPLMISVGLRLKLSSAEVEDVAQTVWLRLVEHLTQLRDPAGLPGWLVTTAHREGLRLLSGRRRAVPQDPLDLSWQSSHAECPDPARDLLVAERHEVLLRAFAELSARQRLLLTLMTLDPPLSYAEISVRTGIPVGSIGPTKGRALEKLRETPAVRRYFARAAGEDVLALPDTVGSDTLNPGRR